VFVELLNQGMMGTGKELPRYDVIIEFIHSMGKLKSSSVKRGEKNPYKYASSSCWCTFEMSLFAKFIA
jgi:hypothetical protein